MPHPAPAKLEFVEELLSLSRHAIAAAVQPEAEADKANALAERITESFLSVWGGCSVYLPRAEYVQRFRRDRAIAAEFTGGRSAPPDWRGNMAFRASPFTGFAESNGSRADVEEAGCLGLRYLRLQICSLRCLCILSMPDSAIRHIRQLRCHHRPWARRKLKLKLKLNANSTPLTSQRNANTSPLPPAPSRVFCGRLAIIGTALPSFANDRNKP